MAAPMMSKSEAIQRAGGASRLARIFGVTPGAINMWPGDTIPLLRRYQLLELRPEWFLSQKGGKENA